MSNSGIPAREIKDLQYGLDARATVLAGVTKGYEAVSSTYGPSGQNVLQGMPFGDPVLTRDGVTVAKRVVLENRAENDAWSVVRQASEKTNKTAGDGTTATVVLSYNLYKAAHQRVVAGENPMKLKAQMYEDSRKVIEFIKSKSVSADKHLLEVATVSAGDANIGALVSDVMQEIGLNGGITIREQNYPTIDVEKINGYYFNKGFFALNQQVEWAKPLILVTQKPLAAASDMLPIIQLVNQQDEKKLVIIGEVRGEAMQILLANTMAQADPQGRPVPFEGIVVAPPMYGEEAKLFMEDIAIYTGAKVLTDAETAPMVSHFGSAERVQVSQERAIVFKGAGSAEAISSRAAEIKTNIDTETNSHLKDNLEQRYSKLVGKVAIVNVGAATDTEMEELRFRVEDAIEATKSAMADGVLTGGATMLVHASQLKLDSLFSQALIGTFSKLFENAGYSAEYAYESILRRFTIDKGTSNHKPEDLYKYGYNLRDMNDGKVNLPVDLHKAGIWDATRAVVQTIENATSAAGALLTVGALVTPRDEVE